MATPPPGRPTVNPLPNEPISSPPPRDTLPTKVLRLLADSVCRHPRWWFYPQVLLCIIATVYTFHNLKLSTNRDDLVGSDKKYHQNFLKFRAEFPRQDDIVAVVESEDLERNRQFVERLGRRLAGETNLFVDVMYNNDLKMLGNKALLFFPEPDLVEFQKTLADYQPFLKSFAQATNLDSLFRLINYKFRTARAEENSENEAMLKAFPALERIVGQATDSLRRAGTPPSPGIAALISPDAGREAIRQQYITFDQGRMFIVTGHAVNANLNGDAVERMRLLVQQTQGEVPGVNVAITGEPVLEYDEMRQSESDSTKATILSLVIVAIIFIFGYNSTGRPIKANVCLIIGLGYTMGYTTLVVGHLNILTITFVPMLIGMAIDFGVHLITRYEEELRHGRSEREAIEKAVVNTGQGIFTGCFTTAGAFFAMSLTNFKGIQEMGIITGGGMLICLIPMMTMLPVLLLRGRQNVLDHTPPPEIDKRARIERLWLDRPRTVIALTLALCGVCLAGFPRVFFDYNLLNMQTAGLSAVVFEKKLIDTADKSVLYGAVIADSLDHAVELETKLTNLVTVASVDSMARFLREDQSRKLALVTQIKNQVRGIQFAPFDTGPANPKALSQTLDILTSYLGKAMEEVAKEKDADQKLLSQLQSLRVAVKELSARVANGPPAEMATKVAAYQQALFRDIQETFATIRNQDDSGPMREDDLPAALRHRFVGVTGKHLIQVNPKQDVWQRDKQEAFVKDVRTVDPEVTGTPVQLYEYTTLLKDSYVEAAWYALGAIAILVFLHFRSIGSVILSLIPVAIGTIWMVGFMAYTGIPFNPANIMTLPLVIGIGVTNGIHILNRFAEEKNPGILGKSTGKAVLVSGLTTVAGFGSLILAKHQGIASLGYVMAVGTATCMIAGLTFLPALLNLMGSKKNSNPGGSTPVGP